MPTDTQPSTAVVVAALATPEWQAKIDNALPANVTRERFVSTAITAVRNFKEAAECTKDSLYNSVLQAAQAGLMPDGRQGALVAFKVKLPSGAWEKQARFMPMVEGIIHQLGNCGINAYAVSVYEKDEIKVWHDDSGQHVTHMPMLFGDRGARIGALACAQTPDGTTYVEVLNVADLEKIRSVSRAKDQQGNPTGPWKDWPDRMEQKSALHRLAKRVPKPDDARVSDEDEPAVVTEPEQPRQRPAALQAVIDQAPPVPPPPSETIETDFTEEEVL